MREAGLDRTLPSQKLRWHIGLVPVEAKIEDAHYNQLLPCDLLLSLRDGAILTTQHWALWLVVWTFGSRNSYVIFGEWELMVTGLIHSLHFYHHGYSTHIHIVPALTDGRK